MRISFNISAFGPGAEQAAKIKDSFEAILKESGLNGETKGMNYEQFASLFGSFTNEVKKDISDEK
ncbi:MAG: hypothetical protein K0R31_1544 [Clostridiales bacterium]|jgi:hypothetical protein|nr:hypothetical protein [Clostridiales bacterium]